MLDAVIRSIDGLSHVLDAVIRSIDGLMPSVRCSNQ